MNLQLQGSRALVTGGSRGVGRCVVSLLAEEGARVEFCARSAPEARAVETEVTACGGPIRGSVVDMADERAVTAWAGQALTRLEGLDIVVANASAMASGDSDEAWQQNYRVEIAGLRHLLAVALPHLKEAAQRRGDAAIVAIGSTAVSRAENADAYGAVKAALVRTMKGLSRALIRDGIRANTVSPGPIFAEDGIWGRIKRDDLQTFAEKVSQLPLGRMATPEEVANVVVFLCSPCARYIAGSNVVVDGGRSDRPQY